MMMGDTNLQIEILDNVNIPLKVKYDEKMDIIKRIVAEYNYIEEYNIEDKIQDTIEIKRLELITKNKDMRTSDTSSECEPEFTVEEESSTEESDTKEINTTDQYKEIDLSIQLYDEPETSQPRKSNKQLKKEKYRMQPGNYLKKKK